MDVNHIIQKYSFNILKKIYKQEKMSYTWTHARDGCEAHIKKIKFDLSSHDKYPIFMSFTLSFIHKEHFKLYSNSRKALTRVKLSK